MTDQPATNDRPYGGLDYMWHDRLGGYYKASFDRPLDRGPESPNARFEG